MEPIKVSTTTREIPVGTYSAITGGNVSEFKVKDKEYRAEFAKGVRGFGYSDAITVDYDGEIYSSILGVYAVGLKLKEIVWKEL